MDCMQHSVYVCMHVRHIRRPPTPPLLLVIAAQLSGSEQRLMLYMLAGEGTLAGSRRGSVGSIIKRGSSIPTQPCRASLARSSTTSASVAIGSRRISSNTISIGSSSHQTHLHSL